MEKEREFYERLEGKGVSRRNFMRYCTFLAATMGLSSSFVPKVAEVLAAPKLRPPVVWLHLGECTGCTAALLRSTHPWVDQLVLEILSIDYHKTIMAAAGYQAKENLHTAIEQHEGKFICIVEGAIPTGAHEGYGMSGGKTFLEIAKEVCPKAAAVISFGSCSVYGGVQAAKPNPGEYKSVEDAIGMKTLNIPGCPPNVVNLIGTIVNHLLFGTLPALDGRGRPKFAYSKTVHDQCPRGIHYMNGEFVTEFGSEEEKMGWCLYEVGCKGPATFNNCSIAEFNDGTNWPIQAGHPCIGCSEPDFWDRMTPFYEPM